MIRRSGGLDSAFATLSALSVCAAETNCNFAGSRAEMSCAICNSLLKIFQPTTLAAG